RNSLEMPSVGHLLTALRLGALVTCWFVLVYGGADWLTAQHSLRIPIAMPWERQIPFVPAAVPFYTSLNLLFLLTPFVLKRTSELEGLAKTLCALIAVAGIGFVLLPADLAYDEVPPAGRWQGLFNF